MNRGGHQLGTVKHTYNIVRKRVQLFEIYHDTISPPTLILEDSSWMPADNEKDAGLQNFVWTLDNGFNIVNTRAKSLWNIVRWQCNLTTLTEKAQLSGSEPQDE